MRAADQQQHDDRLEHDIAAIDRYRRIWPDSAAIEQLVVDLFRDTNGKPPKEIVGDLGAANDPLRGHQQGRFLRNCDDCHCCLPLDIVYGRPLLAATLRRSTIEPLQVRSVEMARIVGPIRHRGLVTARPHSRVGLRGLLA